LAPDAVLANFELYQRVSSLLSHSSRLHWQRLSRFDVVADFRLGVSFWRCIAGSARNSKPNGINRAENRTTIATREPDDGENPQRTAKGFQIKFVLSWVGQVWFRFT